MKHCIQIFFFSENRSADQKQNYRKQLYEGGTNVFTKNPGHMTKMAAMPIYGRTPYPSSLKLMD